MFLLSSIVIVLLFILCITVPFLSFLLPVYKIKKMSSLSIKERLGVNILAMIMLGFLDPIFLVMYLGFFIVIELLYYYFKNFRNNVGIFDRITITTIVITAIMGLYSYFVRTDLNASVEILKGIYSQKLSLSNVEIERIFKVLKENYIFILFIYSGISTYFTYYILDRDSYANWRISYKWTILYIIGFAINRFMKTDNYIGENIIEIVKLIYVVYGIKIVYSILNKMFKFSIVNNIISIMAAIMMPNIIFIIGALKSFDIIKVKITKK